MQPRRMQFRLRWLMAAVVLAAANCAVLRVSVVAGAISSLLALALLPMLDVLLPGILVTASQLRRQGACHAFLAGFEVFGWAAVLVFTEFCLSPSAFDALSAYLQAVIAPLERLHESWGMKYDPESTFQELYGLAICSAVLSFPLLIAGLLGGCLAWASGITLARSRRIVGGGARARDDVQVSNA